jgi:WD40 repeat protein
MKQAVLLFLMGIGFLTLSGQDDEYLIQTFSEHKGKVNTVAFSKSGMYLASGGEDKLLMIRNLKDGVNDVEIADNYFPVKDVEFYGDNQLFITAGRDAKLIDLQNNTLALYQGNTTHMWSLDFAPERNKLTAGSYDNKIRVWDVQSEEVDLVLEGHTKSTLPVAFSLDEKYIVSGSRDLTIKVWNAKTGELMHSLEKHSDNIFAIKFHPNTRYFASGSFDKTIRIWDIEKMEVVKTYAGHDGSILDIEFSPEGYFMYSASVDGIVYVWEVSTGEKLYSYILHNGGVNAVAVSNDGNFVATAGDDGKVMLWKSAKYIVVNQLYGDKLAAEKLQMDVFSSRKKGEAKDVYESRMKQAEEKEAELIDKYFALYKQQKNFKNIPQE